MNFTFSLLPDMVDAHKTLPPGVAEKTGLQDAARRRLGRSSNGVRNGRCEAHVPVAEHYVTEHSGVFTTQSQDQLQRR